MAMRGADLQGLVKNAPKPVIPMVTTASPSSPKLEQKKVPPVVSPAAVKSSMGRSTTTTTDPAFCDAELPDGDLTVERPEQGPQMGLIRLGSHVQRVTDGLTGLVVQIFAHEVSVKWEGEGLAEATPLTAVVAHPTQWLGMCVCAICHRKFGSAALLKQHCGESKLHRDNSSASETEESLQIGGEQAGPSAGGAMLEEADEKTQPVCQKKRSASTTPIIVATPCLKQVSRVVTGRGVTRGRAAETVMSAPRANLGKRVRFSADTTLRDGDSAARLHKRARELSEELMEGLESYNQV